MKIVVLAGGTSTERDVSIVSGTGICGALRQKGHQAIRSRQNMMWKKQQLISEDLICRWLN